MNNTQMILLARAENALHEAKAKIANALTLREAVQAAQNVSVPPPLRAVIRSTPSYRALHTQAEQRLTELIEKQLKQLKELPQGARTEALIKLRTSEWVCLRGDYARILQIAERKATSLCARAP